MSNTSESLKSHTLGRYQLVRQIGAGSMGDVYEGYEPDLDRRVAIKVLPFDLAQQEDFIRRFRREASAAGSLTHPNIVSVHYFGEQRGQYFFVMQYVPGQSLAERLVKQPPLTLDEKLDIFEQCLMALAVAHRADLIHRDIKPANILLNSDTQQAMLADFGLVKSTSSATRMTMTGVVLGTVDYLSPEQAVGRKLDGRADLYSLGVLMYQLLSGRLPFPSKTPAELTYQHAYETPPSLWQVAPNSPAPLVRIIERLMAKDPDGRYPIAEEVSADVRAYRRGESISTDTESFTQVILAPPEDYSSQLPRVALVDHRQAPRTFWQRAGDLLFHRLAEHAPQLADALQNTTQQVDRAVDQQQRRRNELARLINAAQRSVQELQVHADQYRQAAVSATEREAVPNHPQTARSDEAEYQEAAEGLDQQIARQQFEIEQMHTSLEKADSQLIQLRGERDALIARLRAAERELSPRNQGKRARILAAVILLVLTGVTMFIYANRGGPASNDEPGLSAQSRAELLSLEGKLDAENFSDIAVTNKILAIDASHPKANLLVGKHFCFLQGQWDRGLPYLAVGSNRQIAEAARLDLEFPTVADKSVQLADAWWKIAEAETLEIGNVIRSRALEWYGRAFRNDGISDGLRAQIEQRFMGADGIGRWAVFAAEVDTDFGWTTVQFPNAPFAFVLKHDRELTGVGWQSGDYGEIRFGNGKPYSHLACSIKAVLVVQLPQDDPFEVFIKQGADPTSKTRVRLRRNGELVMDVTGNLGRNSFFLDGKTIPEETSSIEAVEQRTATNEAWSSIPIEPYFQEISTEDLRGGLLTAEAVRKVDASGPADNAGLRPGDRIIAVDGLRIFGPYEYHYVRYQGCQVGRHTLRLTIVRDGKLQEIAFQDLELTRKIGFFDPREFLHFDDLLSSLNIAFDESVAWSLRRINLRACLALKNWLDTTPTESIDLQWLKEFVSLFSTISNQKWSEAKPVEQPIPIPYFQSLTDFYLSLAERNAEGEQVPDPSAHDVSFEFYVFNYPLPRFVSPELGNPKITDKGLVKWLQRCVNNPALLGRVDCPVRFSEPDYLKDDPLATYVRRVQWSLAMPIDHRGWPVGYRGEEYSVRSAAGRAKLITDLEDLREKHPETDHLLAYCSLGSHILEVNIEEVLAIIKDLRAESPYLAFRAIQLAQWISGKRRQYSGTLFDEFWDRLEEYLDANPFQLTPKNSLFVDYVQEKTPESAPPFFWIRFQPDDSSIDHPLRLAHVFRKEEKIEMGTWLHWSHRFRYGFPSDQPSALHDVRRFLDQDQLDLAAMSLIDSLTATPITNVKMIYSNKDQTTDDLDQYYAWLLRDIVAHPEYNESLQERIGATILRDQLP